MDKPIQKQKISRTTLLAGSGVLGVFLLISWAIFSNKADSLVLDKNGLVIKEVQNLPFQEMISVDGTIQPLRTVFIDALEGGKVLVKHHQDGALLKKGDTILELVNRDLQLDILNRETAIFDLITNIQHTRNLLEQNRVTRLAELADLQYRLLEAERIYALNEKLYAKGVIARQEFDQVLNEVSYLRKKEGLVAKAVRYDSVSASSQIAQMQVSLRQAEKNLAMMKGKLNDLVITAPIEGQLSAFNAEEGQLIAKGENIGQLDDLHTFKGRALIDETFINRVYAGQRGMLRLDNDHFPVKVSRVYPTVQNGQFTADVLFVQEIPSNLKRGQNMTVRLELSESRDAVVAPKGSFFQSTGGQWVFVLRPDGKTAEKRIVRFGRQNPDYYEVTEGISPGEKIIVSNYRGFEDYEFLTLE